MNNLLDDAVHLDPYKGFVDTGKELNLRFGFQLGQIHFLVEDNGMCEVITQQAIYPVPNTPTWVSGLINHRGVLLPVFDISSHILDEQHRQSSPDTLLVLGSDDTAFAIFANGLPITINLDEQTLVTLDQIPDETPEKLREYVNSVYLVQNQAWHDIDYHQLIDHLTRDLQSNSS